MRITRLRVERSSIFMLALILLLGLLIVYPIVMVFFGSLKTAGPLVPSPFSLQGYQDAFASAMTYKTLLTTAWLAIVRAFLCLAVAVALAWIVTRTDTPGRKYLEVAVWMAFFLPFQPYIIAWILLAGGRAAILNSLLMDIFPSLESAPLDIFSYGGIIFVSVVKVSALVFLLITPAFRGMDASLEESSRMSGASTFTTLYKVTLPVLAPALLAGFVLAFMLFMESFITEQYLGFGKGIIVYSTRIYALIAMDPVDYPQGMALSSVFVVMIIGLVMLQRRLLQKKEFTTITGRGFATRRAPLGRLKYVTLGFVLLYILLALVMPGGTMIAGSLVKTLNYFGPGCWTTMQWQRVFADASVWGALKASMVLAVSTATIGVLLYSLVTYISIRTKLKGRGIVDFLSWLPWGVPRMILALGMLWAFIGSLPLKFLYGSMFLMIVVCVVVHMPFGCRVMTGALHQLGKELEESSRTLGASWLQSFRYIVIPILIPSMISAWIVIFMGTLTDLNSIIFLYSADNIPIAALMFDFWNSAWEQEKSVVIGVMFSFIVLFFALLGRWVTSKLGGQITAM